MRYERPIAPIEDNFAHTGGMYQGITGWLNVRGFLKALREVRHERRSR